MNAIETVRAVSPSFAKVAELAELGLRFQTLMESQGYVRARVRKPKTNGVATLPVDAEL